MSAYINNGGRNTKKIYSLCMQKLTEMKGIKGELGEVKIKLQPDAKPY